MTRVVSWMERTWLAFDCESTGVDVERDSILSIALAWVDPVSGGDPATLHFLLDWGVDVPPEATKVHGLTRALLAEKGHNPAEVLEEVVRCLDEQMGERTCPVVGMNLVYDLTILDRNCRRAGVVPLHDRCEIMPVVDAFVLDKYVDRYRKGKRNLEALAEHYRVPWAGDAHDALADARAAAGVAWRIGRVWPSLGAMDPILLHNLQVQEKVGQDESFREYLVKEGRDATGVDGVWPWKPPQEAAL